MLKILDLEMTDTQIAGFSRRVADSMASEIDGKRPIHPLFALAPANAIALANWKYVANANFLANANFNWTHSAAGSNLQAANTCQGRSIGGSAVMVPTASQTRIAYGPDCLTILPTYRCTAACSNCCFGSHPWVEGRIPQDEILRYIKEAAAFPRMRLVVFSGGECFLLGDDLDEAIGYARPSKFRRCVLARSTTRRWRTLPETRLLVDFFLLNEPVFARRLDETLGEDWRALLDLGIVRMQPGQVARIETLSLFCYNGVFVFVDSPNQDPNIYFGDDSIGLFTRITALHGERVLDLCSGSVIQALNAARNAAAVDAVEVNPLARRVLEVNVLLNGRARTVRAHGGSLFDLLSEGRRYDLITANPPLVPFPEGVEYPFVGHGGADGLIVTRKILAGLPSFLADASADYRSVVFRGKCSA